MPSPLAISLRLRTPASLAAAIALLALPATAIVVRHDRPDADYRRLAARCPAAVARILPDGAGVLVAPRWVMTAAHIAVGTSTFAAVEIEGEQIPVAGRIFHPSWTGSWTRSTVDLALLELARPAAAAPVELYRGADEVDQAVLFCGWGDTGTGETGATSADGLLRAAENRVVSADERTIRFVFDAPPAGEPFEGVSGPGDSGGPALLERAGGWQVAGISSAADRRPPGHYGVGEIYARISTAASWIDGVLAAAHSPAQPLPPRRELAGVDDLAATPRERVLQAFFRAAAAGPEALLRFDHEHRSERSLARRDDSARLEIHRRFRTEHGELAPLAVGAGEASSLPVLARAGASGRCVRLDFIFDAAGGDRIEGFFTTPMACAEPVARAPEVVLPGVVSTPGVARAYLAMAPDARTLYVGRYTAFGGDGPTSIEVSRREAGGWTPLATAPFSGRWADRQPALSPDGAYVYFASRRPVAGVERDDTEIWRVAVTATGWGEPEHLAALSSPADEYAPTVARSGRIYFSSTREGGAGAGDLYVAEPEATGVGAPRSLGAPVNGPSGEWGSSVDEDESLLVFESSDRSGNISFAGDLWVAERRGDGWSEPRHLAAPISSAASDLAPRLTPDGRSLTFASDRDGALVTLRVGLDGALSPDD